MVKDLCSFILLLSLSVSDLTTGLITKEKYACLRYARRQKPDGQYFRVMEMTCCPGYMKVDNRCLDTISKCPVGQFGQQCKLTCNCSSKRCDPRIVCKCKAGYTGAHCDCNSGLIPPVYFIRRKKIPTCPDGYYGMDCKYICDCSANSDCDPETGHCSCHKGYDGRTCNTNCQDQFYGQDCSHHCDCPKQLPCHHVNGLCLCPEGYKGENCNERCPVDTFGVNCLSTCSCVKGKCDPKDGTCTCSPGYTGRLCNEKCAFGFYGIWCVNRCSCSANHQCHHMTGDCHCEPGRQGFHCTERCPVGSFGVNCLSTCSCVKGKCDPKDGTCTCSPCYSGRLCNEKCAFGFYGIGCVNRCSCSANHQCHHMTGDCHCEPGKQGLHCNEKKATVGMAVGIVVGILVLVGSLLLIIVLKRRKNRRPRQQLHQKRGEVNSNHYDDIDYYTEIPDTKLLPNYPYSYADSTDVEPPIKETQPTTERKTNHYLSLTDAQRLSKLSATSGDMKSHGGSTDYLNPYTGLLKDAKCASYQEISKETKERKSISESIQSESGYVKLSSGTRKTKDSNNRQCNDYTDELPSLRYSNGSDLDRITKESRNDSRSSIQSGYLKMNSSLKKKSETEADKSTRNMDDKGSRNNVFRPKITISSHNGDTETLNINNQ